jgi:hypothetical protein
MLVVHWGLRHSASLNVHDLSEVEPANSHDHIVVAILCTNLAKL